jgi:tetratricopeptide (TPR) repeat protein
MVFTIALTRLFLILLAAAILLPNKAKANDKLTCAKAEGDVAIQACSRAIASIKYAGHDRADLYINRGIAYEKNENYDRTISDFSEAIRFDPRYPLLFIDRAEAYSYKRAYDLVIADFTEAIRLDPKSALPFNERGVMFVRK